MVIGVLKLSLILAENHSLKGKRSVLRRIQAQVANKFNVSVTECDEHDMWQSAVLGFGIVGTNARIIDATLRKLVAYVDEMKLAELHDSAIELFHC